MNNLPTDFNVLIEGGAKKDNSPEDKEEEEVILNPEAIEKEPVFNPEEDEVEIVNPEEAKNNDEEEVIAIFCFKSAFDSNSLLNCLISSSVKSSIEIPSFSLTIDSSSLNDLTFSVLRLENTTLPVGRAALTKSS